MGLALKSLGSGDTEVIGRLPRLPEVVSFFGALGCKHIYLNPDFSAAWTRLDTDALPEVYGQVGDLYERWHLEGAPRFVSLLDSKIAVILRGGYRPVERCQMGRGELAFAPDGRIYPCERLIADGTSDHCIGDVDSGLGLDRLPCRLGSDDHVNPECVKCSLRAYCMNWCGCSNYFMTGRYDRVGAFLCASERAAIQVALRVFERLESRLGPTFTEHVAGLPHLASSRLLRA